MKNIPSIRVIKESRLDAVVHTKTKREAIMLVKILGVDEERLYDENDFIECWDGHKENTCYRIRNGKVDQMDCAKFYQKINEEIYEFSDLFATGGVVSIHDLPTSEWYNPRLDLSELVFDVEQAKELADNVMATAELISDITGISYENSINKLKTCLSAFPNDGISAKNGGKNSMKFTFYTIEGYRIDKSNNTQIPTITTEVYLHGSGTTGSATCDKVDYDERQGVIEAMANAAIGNFEREYRRAVQQNKVDEKNARTCSYCGEVFDTVSKKDEHEAWHVECKKARRERYLLRKRAKEIAFEEQAQKLAKEMVEK